MRPLKTIRLLNGLSQSELAHRAGTSLWRINRFENGYLKLRPEEQERLAKVLEADVKRIFGRGNDCE